MCYEDEGLLLHDSNTPIHIKEIVTTVACVLERPQSHWIMDALILTAVEVRDCMSTYIPQKITEKLLVPTLIPVTLC